MYRNFSPQLLGITTRQSEQIEIALTYRYQGLELPLEELCRTATEKGWPHATRFLPGKQLKFTGRLPIGWSQDEAEFHKELAQLAAWAPELAKIGVTVLTAVVEPGSHTRPYHENFELHRTRFLQIGDVLKPHGLELAVGMEATLSARQPYHYQFIGQADALMTLVKTIGLPAVGLLLDTWQWHVGGGTWEQLSHVPLQLIKLVVMSDLPTEYDPATVDSSSRLWANQTGTVPNREFWAHLRDGQFEGPVALSVSPEPTRGGKRDQVLAHAQQVMDQLDRGELSPTEQDTSATIAP